MQYVSEIKSSDKYSPIENSMGGDMDGLLHVFWGVNQTIPRKPIVFIGTSKSVFKTGTGSTTTTGTATIGFSVASLFILSRTGEFFYKASSNRLSSGMYFLGWTNFPYYKKLRKKTKERMFKKIANHPKKKLSGPI